MAKKTKVQVQLEEKYDANCLLLDKKAKELYLKHFGIKSLHSLIGRTMRINYIHRMYDGEFAETEITFLISSYLFDGNIYIRVPTIGLDGDTEDLDENCVLEMFPSNSGKDVLFCISLMSHKLEKRVSYATEEKNDERLKVILI